MDNTKNDIIEIPLDSYEDPLSILIDTCPSVLDGRMPVYMKVDLKNMTLYVSRKPLEIRKYNTPLEETQC